MNITEQDLPCADAAIATEPPIVFVVDDDSSVHESLAPLIRSAGWHPKLLSSAQEFLTLPRIHAPCCLLVAVDLPDVSGLDLQQRISDRTDMPIIFLGDPGDISTVVKAMKAGAVEFLTKPFRNDVIRSAIRDAIERSRAAERCEAGMTVLRQRYAALSRREREVLELMLSGWLNKQIAAKLGISEITVKAHRGTMMRKMCADSFLALLKTAIRLRLMPVTKTQSAPAQPVGTQIVMRSGSLRTSNDGEPEGLCLQSPIDERRTTEQDDLHASFGLLRRFATASGMVTRVAIRVPSESSENDSRERGVMKKSRFTEEAMVKILREADEAPVSQPAKKDGVSDVTIYAGRKPMASSRRLRRESSVRLSSRPQVRRTVTPGDDCRGG
jgi:FixJ family two-component response regulator